MESLHQSALENITALYQNSLGSLPNGNQDHDDEHASDFASQGSLLEVFLDDESSEERRSEHFQLQDDSSETSEDLQPDKKKIEVEFMEIFVDQSPQMKILDPANLDNERIDHLLKEMAHKDLPNYEPSAGRKKGPVPKMEKSAPQGPRWTQLNKESHYKGIILPPFLETRGPTEDFSQHHPYEIFSLYITEELKDYMVAQTNLYVAQLKEERRAYIESHKCCRLALFKDINKDELEVFLGLYLLTSIHSMREYKDYYSESTLLKTNFSKYMGRERFLAILSFIHLSNNANPLAQTDKLYKIRYFYEYVQRKWSFYYQPGKELNIDEGMVPFTGRLGFLQYIKRKPHKWGIKVFLLCDSASAYCLKSTIFSGKDSNAKIETLVKDLLEPYKNKGHILYVDNFYTTISLMKELKEIQTGCTGTFQSKRIGDRAISKGLEIKKGETRFYTHSQSEDILLCLYRDRKLVKVLSNCASLQISTKQIEKKTIIKHVPKVLDDYNAKARGVDRSNQLSLEFSHPHKSTKWWKVLFDYIIQVCITNAFIIYQHYHPKVNHKTFILSIIERLLKQPQKKKSHLLHLPAYLDPNLKSGKRLKCKNCDRLSQFYCKECSTMSKKCSLCMPDCWRAYHQNLHNI